MEDPDSVSITNIFILDLLTGLVQFESDFILTFLGKQPRIKDRIGDKIQAHFMHLQSLLILDSQKSSRTEWNIRVYIFLVVEARFKTEHTGSIRHL